MSLADSTRARIAALRAKDPDMTAAELAREVGVSRERVRQHLRALGLPTTTARSLAAQRNRERSARPPRPRILTGGVQVPVSATIVGTIGELLVAADLMARGFKVFFPFTRTGHCDLVALDQHTGKTERIEVRCGHRSGKRIIWQKPDTRRSDRRAIVLTGEPVMYDPPFE